MRAYFRPATALISLISQQTCRHISLAARLATATVASRVDAFASYIQTARARFHEFMTLTREPFTPPDASAVCREDHHIYLASPGHCSLPRDACLALLQPCLPAGHHAISPFPLRASSLRRFRLPPLFDAIISRRIIYCRRRSRTRLLEVLYRCYIYIMPLQK